MRLGLKKILFYADIRVRSVASFIKNCSNAHPLLFVWMAHRIVALITACEKFDSMQVRFLFASYSVCIECFHAFDGGVSLTAK